MPTEITNDVKLEQPLQGNPENQTLMHPRFLGKNERESFTDASNARQNVVRVVEGDDIQKALDNLEAIGGGVLQFKTGTYRLQKGFDIPSFVTIQGEGRDNTILDFEDRNLQITAVGTVGGGVANDPAHRRNIRIRDLTIQRSGNTASAISFQFCDFLLLENVRVSNNAGSGMTVTSCQQYTVINCLFDNNTQTGITLTAFTTYAHARFNYFGCAFTDNASIGARITGSSSAVVINGAFVACEASNNTLDGFDVDTGVEAALHYSGCISNSNGGIGFDINSSDVTLTGCKADSNTGDGIEITQIQCTVQGCVCNSNGGRDYDLQQRANFVGNSIEFGAAIQPSGEISLTTAAIQSLANTGGNFVTQRVVAQMGNSSSSTSIQQGATITHASVASGEAFTTTTTSGDDKVLGMAMFDISSNQYGAVLTEGYTTLLKVDGTTDIAVGDFLGTHTVDGIAAKVTSGMAFAIALEAYTANDSNGVIDALLIKPRKIGSASGNESDTVTATTNATTTAQTNTTITSMSITRSLDANQVVMLVYTADWSVSRGSGQGTAAALIRDDTAGTDLTPQVQINMQDGAGGQTAQAPCTIHAIYTIPSTASRTFVVQHRSSDSSTTSTMGQRRFSLVELS